LVLFKPETVNKANELRGEKVSRKGAKAQRQKDSQHWQRMAPARLKNNKLFFGGMLSL